MMFKKEYTFSGSHAEKVKTLVSKFSDYSGSTLFQRNVDVLLFAPIVGLLFGNTSSLDKSTNTTTKIFTDQMIREDLGIRFNFQLVSLLDKKSTDNNSERIDLAFRSFGNEDDEEKYSRFNEYILGGIDILYDKLIEPEKNNQDYIANLYDFLEEINDRYNEDIKEDRVNEIIAIARDQE